MDIFAILLRYDVFLQKLAKLMTTGASGNPLLFFEFPKAAQRGSYNYLQNDLSHYVNRPSHFIELAFLSIWLPVLQTSTTHSSMVTVLE